MKELILQFEVMDSKAIDVYKGLERTNYLDDKAQLKGFEAIESNWQELFRWIMSVGKQVDFYDKNGNKNGNFSELWFNHIYTVLIDILQRELEKDESEFIQKIGTEQGTQDASDLKSEVQEWIRRIGEYIHIRMMKGDDIDKCPAIEVAENIKKELEQSLGIYNEVAKETEDSGIHNTMWKAINRIKKNGDSYLQLIENAGNMDSGLSLLLIFIRNYSRVVRGFNLRFSQLPEFYHNRILMVSPQKAIQDKTRLLITPVNKVKGYLLPSKTKFIAGKKEDDTELIYETEKEEYISGMKVADAFAVFPAGDEGKIYRKSLYINDTTPLRIFEKDENCSDYICGWMIESRIFLVREGEVKVNIEFLLTEESVKKIGIKTIDQNAFFVYASDNKGWGLIENKCEYKKVGNKGVLNILVIKHKVNNSFVPASVALHNIFSDFPVFRLLIKNKRENYDFARLIEFTEVKIDLEVLHSHNIKLYNELGEIDISKPYYPFGVQAECSSWFRFGNEEIVQKKVDAITLSGIWNKIPKTDQGYEDIYRYWYYNNNSTEIKVTNASFKIKCEVFINGNWKDVTTDSGFLFSPQTGKLSDQALIELKSIGGILLNSTENGLNRYCPFRIILNEPGIGFGMEEYRNVFAERMIYSSNINNTVKRPLPTAPLIPMLADVGLSYKASENLKLLMPRESTNNGIRLSRISELNKYNFSSVEELKSQLFVLEDINVYSIYLGISNTLWKKHVKMYFDLSFIKQDLFGKDINSDVNSSLEWHCLKNNLWNYLDSKYVLVDETCGLTQSGYIELELPELTEEMALDSRNLLWLKVNVNKRDMPLAIRNIYMDYISVVAENGDGMSIPSLSIKKIKEEDNNIDKVIQPLPGYNGKMKESRMRSSVRQSSRIFNRFRALTPADYEQLILERFSEIEKVCCIPANDAVRPDGPPTHEVNIVVFSRSDDSVYPYTPEWKLNEIKQYISNYISPYSTINIINPLYENIAVDCVATVKLEVTVDGKTVRRMVENINNYFLDWMQEGTLPELGKSYSCKSLHRILANDKDVVKVFDLLVNGVEVGNTDINVEEWCICGQTPWSILIPRPINLKLLLYSGGVGHAMIDYNFIIN